MNNFNTLLACLTISASIGCSAKVKPQAQSDKRKTLVVYATAELKGSMEPCGCTTDPLGDIARTAALIEKDRASGPVLVVDGGSTLFPSSQQSELMAPQEKLKAETLSTILTERLQISAAALGDCDLNYGHSLNALPRLGANVTVEGSKLPPTKIVTAGPYKIGILAVTSQDASIPGATITDPAPAAEAAVTSLRGENVDLVFALLHMTDVEAKRLVGGVSGIDFALIGRGAPTDPAMVVEVPQKVGNTWLVQPADRGQIISRIEISLDGDGEIVDAIGELAAPARIAEIQGRIERLQQRIDEWKSQEDTDGAFIAKKEEELADLEDEVRALQKQPFAKPEQGPWMTLAQMRITKNIDCSSDIIAMKAAYNSKAGLANVEAAKGIKPPAPPEGTASYVGSNECADCHEEAWSFWQTTRHHGAWQTLVDDNQQFDYECIGCHVTGWDQPGGSNMGFNENLRSVQCETCHGPGSIHIEDNEPTSIHRDAPETLCVNCHNEKHSNTFDYKAYLRDVTGPGHGADFRKSLGDGPTGAELRAEGLAKAAQKIGANCPK